MKKYQRWSTSLRYIMNINAFVVYIMIGIVFKLCMANTTRKDDEPSDKFCERHYQFLLVQNRYQVGYTNFSSGSTHSPFQVNPFFEIS